MWKKCIWAKRIKHDFYLLMACLQSLQVLLQTGAVNTFLHLIQKKSHPHYEGTSSNKSVTWLSWTLGWTFSTRQLTSLFQVASMCFLLVGVKHGHLSDGTNVQAECKLKVSLNLLKLIWLETNRCSWYRTISAPIGPVVELLCWFLRITTYSWPSLQRVETEKQNEWL